MAIDSQVASKTELSGYSKRRYDALVAADITSYATFASCCNFQPRQSDDSALTAFLTMALGAVPSAAVASKFHRLLFLAAYALSPEDL